MQVSNSITWYSLDAPELRDMTCKGLLLLYTGEVVVNSRVKDGFIDPYRIAAIAFAPLSSIKTDFLVGLFTAPALPPESSDCPFEWDVIAEQYNYVTIDANSCVMYGHENRPHHCAEQASYIGDDLSYRFMALVTPISVARFFTRPGFEK